MQKWQEQLYPYEDADAILEHIVLIMLVISQWPSVNTLLAQKTKQKNTPTLMEFSGSSNTSIPILKWPEYGKVSTLYRRTRRSSIDSNCD